MKLHAAGEAAGGTLPPFPSDASSGRAGQEQTYSVCPSDTMGRQRMSRCPNNRWLRAYFARNPVPVARSEEHTSELQSLMRTSYAVFCLKKNNITHTYNKSTKK